MVLSGGPRRSMHIIFDLILFPALAITFCGYFGGKDRLFDLVNYARPEIPLVALVLILVALLARDNVRLVIAVFLLAASLWPLLVRSAPAAPDDQPGQLRIMTVNVDGWSSAYDRFTDMIRDEQPDVVVMQETTREWRDAVTSLTDELPYVTQPSLGGKTNIVIASRYPFASSLVEVEPLAVPTDDIGGSLAIRAVVDWEGARRPLVLYAIHAPTVRKFSGWMVRNLYLRAIARRAASESPNSNVMVAGDWNTPYWSPVVASFMRRSGMSTTERGAWPPATRFFRGTGLPPSFGVPIDRIAVSKGIAVAGVHVSEDFGSDHLAVIADLVLP